MNHFSLFTGIGGIDLAAEWAGFTTVGQCEWADYQTKVLEKHWPNVPRWRDIRSVTAESAATAGISDITLVSGGFPCQPFSAAGKRLGREDNRFLWPEMLRVIRELRPAWVLGENVPGIINLELESVCADLEDSDYGVRPFTVPACSVNAPHKRGRVFIVAHANNRGRVVWGDGKLPSIETADGCGNPHRLGEKELVTGEWRSYKPRVARVVDGVPNRVHRLTCLGNAVVPPQVYPILRAIAIIESHIVS